MESIDRREILARERHAGLADGLVDTRAAERGRRARRAARPRRAPRPFERRAAPALDVCRHRPAEQQREVLDPRPRQREQRLEEQVQQQVVAPDVDDEGDVGPDRGDVGEVLVGTDADVRAAADAALLQVRNDVQIRALVRDQVVGVEVSRRLGQRRDLGREGRLRLRPRGATRRQAPR